jgi:hypothetical protein
MSSTFKSEQERISQEKHDFEERSRRDSAFGEFFRRHRELVSCEANINVLEDYLGGSEFVDLDSLEQALGHSRCPGLVRQTTEEERAKLIAEICELMKGGTSADAITAWRGRTARYQDVETLQAKKTELVQRIELRTKTPRELRKLIQAARPGVVQELPREISRQQILQMWGPAEFRFWANKFGTMEPITRRINEKN